MLIQHTMTQLKSLKLDGMARALEEQQTMPASQALAFEDRLGLLVEREITWRETRNSPSRSSGSRPIRSSCLTIRLRRLKRFMLATNACAPKRSSDTSRASPSAAGAAANKMPRHLAGRFKWRG